MILVYIANGDGSKAVPHTVDTPKSLLKILGHTAIEHNLSQAAGFVDKIIIAAGFNGDAISAKLGDSFSAAGIEYMQFSSQDNLDAIICAIKDLIDTDFLVLTDNGIYSKADIGRCIKAGRSKAVQDGSGCGIYSFKLEDVEQIIVKGFEGVAKELEPIDIEDYCLPFVYPWHILEANVFLLSRFTGFANHGTVEEGAVIKGDVYIGEGTVIKSHCYIEGPAFIDSGCTIGPFAYIRKDSIIGKGVQVGRMEMYDVVIMDGFTSKHYSYAGHSVIGEGGNFGAGTITSDYRHDGSKHTTVINGEKVETNRRKLGAFLGSGVTTGVGTLIYPGRKIWPKLGTLPGEIVKFDKSE